MSFIQYFTFNIEKVLKAYEIVNNVDSHYYDIITINEINCNNDTISIVMTTSNRTEQTYFTLNTISKSKHKNVQIIIIEDSNEDKLNVETLKQFGLHIDLIIIKNKFWFNPCVNYNMGFKFIKGGKIIIQNGEVCHIGDIVNYINNNLVDNSYFIFDVISIANMENNKILYQIDNITANNKNEIGKLSNGWLQHHIFSNRKLHFLTAMTTKTFEHIKHFDFDYSVGCAYDDDDFIFKIETVPLNIVIVPETIGIFGIHQWHKRTEVSDMSNSIVSNQLLFILKRNYYIRNKKHLDFTKIVDLKSNPIETIINVFQEYL